MSRVSKNLQHLALLTLAAIAGEQVCSLGALGAAGEDLDSRASA